MSLLRSPAKPARLAAMKAYNFPSATIKVYPDRTCREFPKWCACISVERSREYVAQALRMMRSVCH